MLSVDADPLQVERLLRAKRLTCPRCAGTLCGWGHGRSRALRGALGATLWLRPRRARCSRCGATHILLSELALPRCADAVTVIGAALELAARGTGHRSIARGLAVHESTVRGWLRRFALRAWHTHRLFSAMLAAAGKDLPRPAPGSPPLTHAVAVVLAAARACGSRPFAQGSPWTFACRTARGALLAPDTP